MKASLSSPDKILWPAAGFTKRDLWEYMEAVGDRLLRQVADRPLTLKRFPNGVDAEGFFQKNLPDSAPADIRRYRAWTPTSGREVAYAVVTDAEELRWMANQAAIEYHPWFTRTDRPERCDLLAFDLDPPGEGPGSGAVVAAARWLHALLDELGLQSAVKTSGKRGLHIYVPVERRYAFSELRGFGLAVARACADRHPDVLTVEMRKAERDGRLLLDWSRPGPAQTLVAAWSPRAHPAGTVSTPLEWDEVDDDLDPTGFTIASAPARPDHWERLPAPQRIERARATLTDAGYVPEDRSPRGGRRRA